MIKHTYNDGRVEYTPARADNLYDTRIMCKCGKRLMDKKVTEVRDILFKIGTEISEINWYCKINDGHTAASTYYCYMLRFLNRFIRIARIQAAVYVDGYESGYKIYHVVPDKDENIATPTIMNIL